MIPPDSLNPMPAVSSAAGPGDIASIANGRPGILVVDDEPLILRMLDTVLRLHGFSVYCASSSESALELLTDYRSNIVLCLMDVCLRDGDGPTTLKMLRQVDPTLCCCFITGGGSDYTVEGLFSYGAAIVFHKPFDMHHLTRALRHLVFGPDLHVDLEMYATPSGVERRRFPRWRGIPQVVGIARAQVRGFKSQATVLNRSLNGLCVSTSDPFEVGDQLRIRSTATAFEKWLPVEVRHVEPLGQGWAVGCRFVEPPALSILSVYG